MQQIDQSYIPNGSRVLAMLLLIKIVLKLFGVDPTTSTCYDLATKIIKGIVPSLTFIILGTSFKEILWNPGKC